MKKTLHTLCLVAILIFSFSVQSFASDFFCVLETFDSGASDALTLPPGAFHVELEDGRNVLALSGDINNTWTSVKFSPISGLFLASCEFMQPTYGTADVLRVHNSSGGSEIARVWVEGGIIKMQSGSNGINIGSYNTNQWYRIAIIGDTATKSGTLYVDGAEGGSFGFIKTVAFDVGHFVCFNRVNTTTYIDNMYLAPFTTKDSALYFAETFGDTLNSFSMYSESGFNNVYDAFEKIASSTNSEELEEAKAYLKDCQYKLLTSDGSGDYSKEISVSGKALVSESEFRLSGGGGNVLSLLSEINIGLCVTASEDGGLVLNNGESDITIADSLESDKWYTMKVISDSESDKACIILNGAVVFDGDVVLSDDTIDTVSVSGIDGYDGECVVGGAVRVTEAEDYDLAKDILKAEASVDFYRELYTDDDVIAVNDAISVLQNSKASQSEKDEAHNTLKSIVYDIQFKMTDSDGFDFVTNYDTESLDGFGVIEGSFTIVSDDSGKSVVFEPSNKESGKAFCSLFVKNGSLYAQNSEAEVLLLENLELFTSHKLMTVADTKKGKIKIFVNGEYIPASDSVECDKSAGSVDAVTVKLTERNSIAALRGEFTVNPVTGAEIDNIESIEDLNFAIHISDFVRAVNNASRSTVYDLIVTNEELLCDYGLKDDFVSLGENQKSKVCLKLLNKTFTTPEDIADELNKETKNFSMTTKSPHHQKAVQLPAQAG